MFIQGTGISFRGMESRGLEFSIQGVSFQAVSSTSSRLDDVAGRVFPFRILLGTPMISLWSPVAQGLPQISLV